MPWGILSISGQSYFYGDNMSVVHNTSRPKSVLRKKSNLVCNYAVHQSVAMGESVVRKCSRFDDKSLIWTYDEIFGQ